MSPRLIDTHSHLNFNSFKNDHDDVVRRALDKDIWMINIGSQFHTSRRALNIATEYEQGVYAVIGLHPIHLIEHDVDKEEIKFKTREEKFDEAKYQELIEADKEHKIVAIGEIGLDYFHIPKASNLTQFKNIQRKEFIKQVDFANKNNLPIVLHCRGSQQDSLDAYNDLLSLIREYLSPLSGVIHCFGANAQIAKEFIKLGFFIGFTGVITFGKNADELRQVVKDIPLERILVETDCPYLAPDPYRGQRNEPAYVEFVAKKVAEIKKVSFKEVAEITTKNAKKLFNLFH